MRNNFDSNRSSGQPGAVDGFLIRFNTGDSAQPQVILGWNAKRSANSQFTFEHIDTYNDWRHTVEASVRHNLQNAREDSLVTSVILAFIYAFLHIFRERVEQVIDDGCGENFNVILISESLCVRHNFHIEGEDSCELLLHFLLVHRFGSFQNVFSVDRADVDAGDGNFHILQKLEESFKSTNSGCLHQNTI